MTPRRPCSSFRPNTTTTLSFDPATVVVSTNEIERELHVVIVEKKGDEFDVFCFLSLRKQKMLLVLILVMPSLNQVVRTRYPILQVLRSILLMSATGFFFIGISLIPLTDAAALMATNPVLITLGAAVFLGERLGLRRTSGIIAALIGAMIIIIW